MLRRWEVLRQVLEMLMSVHGNHSAYLDLVAAGKHILNVLPGSKLEPWSPPLPEGGMEDPTMPEGGLQMITTGGTFEMIPQTQP